MPLFDRLVDQEPHIKLENEVKNFLVGKELKKSVAREICNIMDTRIGSHIELPNDMPKDYALLPEQFGIRDFADLTEKTQTSLTKVAKHLKTALLRYEPRLLDPVVVVHRPKPEDENLEILVSGDIMIGDQKDTIQFPMVLNNILGQK